MPGARRAKKGQTQLNPSPERKPNKGEGGGVQSFDGSENKGNVPYTRPTPDYDKPGRVISSE